MKLPITLFQDEDGMFIAECPAIPGCVSQGATEPEAEWNLEDAIRECLAARREQGLPLTLKTREIEIAVQSLTPTSTSECGESPCLDREDSRPGKAGALRHIAQAWIFWCLAAFVETRTGCWRLARGFH